VGPVVESIGSACFYRRSPGLPRREIGPGNCAIVSKNVDGVDVAPEAARKEAFLAPNLRESLRLAAAQFTQAGLQN